MTGLIKHRNQRDPCSPQHTGGSYLPLFTPQNKNTGLGTSQQFGAESSEVVCEPALDQRSTSMLNCENQTDPAETQQLSHTRPPLVPQTSWRKTSKPVQVCDHIPVQVMFGTAMEGETKFVCLWSMKKLCSKPPIPRALCNGKIVLEFRPPASMCTLTPIPLLLKFTYLKIDKPGNNQALVCLWVGVGAQPSVMQEGGGWNQTRSLLPVNKRKLLHH